MWCCPPRPGTRSTTCRPRTCTPTSTPSPRRRPALAGAYRLRHLPRPGRGSSASWPVPTSASARTSWRHRAPARHPRRDRQPGGWSWTGRTATASHPGRTMPNLTVVERDYTAIGEKFAALGPLVEKLGLPVKGIAFKPDHEVEDLRQLNGTVRGGPADGRPLLDTAIKACNTILAPVRHDQRPPGHPGLPHPGGAHRPGDGAPRRRARGQAHHVRRHPGRAGAGHHVRSGAAARRAAAATRPSPSTPSI